MPATALSQEKLPEMAGPPSPGRAVNWRVLAFYLLVPLALAGYGAANNWQLIASVGPLLATGFYLGHALLPWLVTCALSSAVMYLLRPWRPRPLVILLAGHTLACIVVMPYVSWLIDLFASRWPDSGIASGQGALFGAEYWAFWLQAGAVWLVVNFVFDRFLGLPRYRYDVVRQRDLAQVVDGVSTPPAVRAAFLERVPAGVRLEDVVAVKAEQHYIRIVTASRSYLVLHRFSDALCDLTHEEGLQVHRSWWIRRSAIARVRQNARRMVAVLGTGEEVPVSGPHQALVRQAARSGNVPVTPLTAE